jgi:Protein of unknown function (DUF3108)
MSTASTRRKRYTTRMSADFIQISYVKRWIFFALTTLILHLGALNWAARHLTRPSELKSFNANKNVTVNLARPDKQQVALPPQPQPQPGLTPQALSKPPKKKLNKPATTAAKPEVLPELSTQAATEPEVQPEPTPAPPAVVATTNELAEAVAVAEAPVKPNGYQFEIPPSMEVKYAVRKSNRVEGKENPTNGRGAIRFLNYGGGYRIEGEFKFLFFTFFSFTSEGGINQFGLAPILYSEKRGTRALTNTHFQQEKKIISFSASTRQFPLSDGAQDRASILWQLASIARAEGQNFSGNTVIDVQVAGERRADLWTFQNKGNELIKLGDRELSTLHLVQQPPEGSYERRIDVWLASQHEWAPVKIVYTEANGNLLEMEMTDVIRLSAVE